MSSEPTSRVRAYALAKVLDGISNRIERVDLYRSCVTCSYFEGARNLNDDPVKQPRCAKHCANPPAFIIANGCDDYVDMDTGQDDDIPF